jgi:hypothetical protein
VFTARYGLIPYITRIRFVFKGMGSVGSRECLVIGYCEHDVGYYSYTFSELYYLL